MVLLVENCSLQRSALRVALPGFGCVISDNDESVVAIEGKWWTERGWFAGVVELTETLERSPNHSASQITIADMQPKEAAEQTPIFIPAPIDCHNHGGGGMDVMSGDEAIRTTLKTHAHYGCGSLLATSVAAPADDITEFINSVKRVMQSPDVGAATLLGAHLEGPFINPDKLGAQPPYAMALDLDLLEVWLSSGVVKVITFAPEIMPDQSILTLCTQYGVRAQLGHSLCTWAQAQSWLASGCGVTHLYNAMSGVSHRNGGLALAALAHSDYAEIITDGIHVDRAAFELARQTIKGLYSVTDATAAAGMPDGDYRLGSYTVKKHAGSVTLPDGTLAGSCLTQSDSIQLLRDWGLAWSDIATLCSSIPAQWLTLTTLGAISPGMRAHWLEIWDDRPQALWLDGARHELGQLSA
ncbi:MAG: amidohydrolase family protein [Gammaproteobacteria bacterium]|nr:amidohydrolase family protein [Gammaproteobacteria bacterium]